MKRVLITLALGLSHVTVAVYSYVLTSLDAQSYYAASVRELLKEAVTAIESNDRSFLPRLKAFQARQPLTYENRGNLLENARQFHAEGEAIRNKAE